MRIITPHKGGRGAFAPHARMREADRQELDELLNARNMSFADWILEKLHQERQAVETARKMLEK